MRQSDIAKAADVHPVLIHQWSTGKRRIPADKVLAVARATGWKVTPNALRPDIYPNPTDGLPPEVVQRPESLESIAPTTPTPTPLGALGEPRLGSDRREDERRQPDSRSTERREDIRRQAGS